MRFACGRANINLEGVTVKSAAGDCDCILANVINIETSNPLVVQARQIRCASFPACMTTRSHSCGTGSRVRELTQTFREAGVDARYVRSKAPVAKPKLWVEGFKVGVSSSCETRFVLFAPHHTRKSNVLK